MKISIVIPSYNHWELTHSLLYDIYNNCSKVDEVLVVNNGSTDKECFSGMDWWIESKLLPIHEIYINKNVGFLKAANLGVKSADGDVVILISNDVQVKTDMVDKVSKLVSNKVIVGGILYDFDTGWNKFGDRLFPYLEGWLLAFTKKAWEDIGGFDELYVPNDYEDIDFSTSAISKGYTLVGLADEKIHHLSGRTIGYSPEREALTKENQKKFKKKWIK